MGHILQLRHNNSRLLVSYWEMLCGSGTLPSQSQVHPRPLKKILPQVFILDAADTQSPSYRLAGTELCERFGRELRGVPFLADWELESQRSVAALLRTAHARRAPVCVETVATLSDLGWVDVEIVIVPLSPGDLGEVRFLGAMQIITSLPRFYRGTITSQRLVASQVARMDESVVVTCKSTPQKREWRPSAFRLV